MSTASHYAYSYQMAATSRYSTHFVAVQWKFSVNLLRVGVYTLTQTDSISQSTEQLVSRNMNSTSAAGCS